MRTTAVLVACAWSLRAGQAQDLQFSLPFEESSYPGLAEEAIASSELIPTLLPRALAVAAASPSYPLFWQHQDASLARWVMNGVNLVSGSLLVPSQVDPQWSLMAVGDFGPGGSPDGQPDLVWERENGELALWYMNGERVTSAASLIPGQVDPRWKIVGTGDFNRDSHPDLVWQSQTGELALWYMNGAAATTTHMLGQVDPAWRMMGVGDFNRDGYPDLVWEHWDGSLALWLMNGSNRSEVRSLTPAQTDPAWKIVRVGDINQDGYPDLHWQHQDGTVAVWFMQINQSTGSQYLNPSSAKDVAWRIAGVRATTVAGNCPPKVSVTGYSVARGLYSEDWYLEATAVDPDGWVRKVEFFEGTSKLGEALTSPFKIAAPSSWLVGLHQFTAKATDNLGTVATCTAEHRFTSIVPAPPPAITSPANNSTFQALATVTINATARSQSGPIVKVEFYVGANKVGEDATSPYSLVVPNLGEGTYKLTVKATDDLGQSATSDVVSITVLSSQVNKAPAATLTSPAQGSSFTAPATITLTANASDPDGTVSKVEFFNGTTKLGEDTTSPYSFSWVNVVVGTYQLTAKATDNKGASASSSVVTITVQNNRPPSVFITSPEPLTFFDPRSTIVINVTAIDPDGTVRKVEFFNGATKLGEDTTLPYTFAWSLVPAGNYTLTAKATDDDGASATSVGVPIVVKPFTYNLPPTVSIASPVEGASFNAPANITVSASARDPDGTVSKVEFFSETTKLGEDITSPYSFTWANVAPGSYSLSVKATDNDGASTVSGSIQIAVRGNQLPAVSITSPIDGTAINNGPATFTINASASDPDGTVSKVEFFNGTTKLGEDTASPYSYTWVNAPVGSYKLTAKATDNLGASSVSSVVTYTVRGNQAPTVRITSPQGGTFYTAPATIDILASAADPDGWVAKVEFFNGGTKIGEDTTSPYSFTWSNVPVGTYQLTAKATDNTGASASTASVPVTVGGQRQLTIRNQALSSLYLRDIVQVKASASNNFGTADLLWNDSMICGLEPGDYIAPGESRTFNITFTSSYYVYLGMGLWEADATDWICPGGGWWKRTYTTDTTGKDHYVYVIVSVTSHTGNWTWTVSGNYTTGTLVVTPEGGNAIRFTVTN